ncbi:Putative flippase GtrA (transmembrane translocase of bactoprenol-linked glucose) [Rhizobiales bacterium GAS113]|jgi:putative flippase GtrA|nr:Putative flippase GtrA (transmembrane translocase of bactoprenol-linked glucose) [Rhizobiales bacterium GAS113]
MVDPSGSIASRYPISGYAIFRRYVAFAFVSGLANLVTQALSIRVAPIYPLQLSILCGTATGFLVKYLLDKRWIFFDEYDGRASELRKIIVYGLFGVGTTLLFWGVELAFLHIGGTDEAKYAGAAIGLAIGNVLKYLLDRKYVFKARPA